MRLPVSARLECCAGLVPQGARAADIGADHGYLGISLLLNGRAEFVHASELREQPLRRAMENALRFGVADRMRFSRADGLDAIDPDEVDTIVCAGMGGDLIAQILHRNVSNIFSVERNLSARHIIETWDQVDQRRFTAAGASDDRRRLARLGNKVDVMQHILLGARITEVDVIEADNSVMNLQLLRIFDILNGGFCLNDFIDTAGGNSGTRQHD